MINTDVLLWIQKLQRKIKLPDNTKTLIKTEIKGTRKSLFEKVAGRGGQEVHSILCLQPKSERNMVVLMV